MIQVFLIEIEGHLFILVVYLQGVMGYGYITVKMKDGFEHEYGCLEKDFNGVFSQLENDLEIVSVYFTKCSCATYNALPFFNYSHFKKHEKEKKGALEHITRQLALFRIC